MIAEPERAEAVQTILALYRQLDEIHAEVVGWMRVAIVHGACAVEARDKAAQASAKQGLVREGGGGEAPE